MNVPSSSLLEKKNTLTPISVFYSNTLQYHGELFDSWLLEQGLAPGSIRHYAPAVERWLKILRSSDGAPEIVWLRWRAPSSVKRLTGFAVRKYEMFLRDVFHQDIALGISKKLPSSTRPNPHPFSETEIKALLKACKTTLKREHASMSLRVFLNVIWTLGLRRQEAFFEWDQIDFSSQILTVLGKGGDKRTLPLTLKLARILKFWRKRSPSFPWTTLNGNRVLPTAMYQNFKKVARATNLPSARLHWFRHTRLTAMASSPGGYDPIHLAAFAGHRQLSSLLHYCQPSLSRLRALLEASHNRLAVVF